MRLGPRLARIGHTNLALLAAGSIALIAIVATDGWRTALLTGLVAAAILATRFLLAPKAGLAFVVAVAVLALTGHGPVSDDRPAPDRAKHARSDRS